MRHKGGFTIVELLIVIVVIAILAAITIVAFNGVQRQAQVSAVASSASTATKKIEAHKVLAGTYPVSINDCPSPAGNSLCLSQGDVVSTTYAPVAEGITNGISASALAASYEYSVQSGKAFIYYSPAIKTSMGNEFMQYVDVAPFIDRYGLVEYVLSFDIKSANTTAANKSKVYFQNGTITKYGGLEEFVNVTTDWSHYEIVFTPAYSTTTQTKAMLAFYGSYYTGNIPTVKNVRLTLK